MGGYGSTRWGWRRRKSCVEDCLTIDSYYFVRQLGEDGFQRKPHPGGMVVWSRGGQVHSTIWWSYINDGRPGIRLSYMAQGKNLAPVIYLTPYPCTFGGLRWYWCCPSCGRRCLCLYLEHQDFCCRKCLNLTYRSAQEAHKYEHGFWRKWGLHSRSRK